MAELNDPMKLSSKERMTLALICDTFVPSLQTENPDLKVFFARSASNIGVDAELARIIEEELPEEQQKQLVQVLHLFENSFLNLILNQTVKFSNLDELKREEYLFKKFGSSSLSLKRQAFQALKRFVMFANYGYVPAGVNENPNWKDIGYSGRSAKMGVRESTKSITPLTITKEGQTFECDICIVGSGAGGSVIAEFLSAAGWKVVVVESGGYYTAEDFVGHQEYEMNGKLFEQMGRATTRDLSLSLLEGHAVGGSTLVNWSTSIKPSSWLRKEWQDSFGISSLTKPEFDSCVDFVWDALKVNKNESELNKNNGVLFKGCEALGYKIPEDYDIIWRNAVDCQERCAYCTHGCQYSCKQSTSINFLPRASLNGCKFIFDSKVERVIVESGKVRGVSGLSKSSNHFIVKSQAVVIAAGSINTPAIIQRSGIQKNVGTNLKLHPTTAVSALYDEKTNLWEGPPQTCKVTKYLDLDGAHHGFWIEAVPAHPALYASATPWTSGRKHKELMSEMAHTTASIVLVREKGSGRVSIDKHGNPVCDYQMTSQDKEWMMRGMIETGKILIASGAKRIASLHHDGVLIDPANSTKLGTADLDRFENEVRKRGIVPNKISLFSAHIMGSAHMGKDQSTAFCDDNAESYEVPGLFIGDASVFPTSPGINPMITIMSMARRNAARIDSRLRKSN